MGVGYTVGAAELPLVLVRFTSLDVAELGFWVIDATIPTYFSLHI